MRSGTGATVQGRGGEGGGGGGGGMRHGGTSEPSPYMITLSLAHEAASPPTGRNNNSELRFFPGETND